MTFHYYGSFDHGGVLMDLMKRLYAAIEMAQEAGKFISAARLDASKIGFKRDLADPVTWYDKEAQRMIIEYLRRLFPEDCFHAEEGGVRSEEMDRVWIIDPIDGTVNYIARIPFYCVSIGYVRDGKPVLGVVYHPSTNETFYALKGNGAFLNGKPISVSRISNPMEAIITLSYHHGRTAELVARMESKVRRVRMYGTAALQAAYVAAGRTEGYITRDTNVWDVAAAQIIVEEAGGMVTDWEGKGVEWPEGALIFSNGIMHELLLKWLRGSEE